MKVRFKVFSNGVETLCPTISFLAQKLRAVAREQTHTDRKANLSDPFFLQFIVVFHICFFWVKPENQKHMKKQGQSNKKYFVYNG